MHPVMSDRPARLRQRQVLIRWRCYVVPNLLSSSREVYCKMAACKFYIVIINVVALFFGAKSLNNGLARTPPSKISWLLGLWSSILDLLCTWNFSELPKFNMQDKHSTFVMVWDLTSVNSTGYNFRGADFHIPRFHSVTYGKHSLWYIGPKLWNLRNLPSLDNHLNDRFVLSIWLWELHIM